VRLRHGQAGRAEAEEHCASCAVRSPRRRASAEGEFAAADARADEITDWLVQFQAAQPGLAHPISDQYAVSLIPTSLALLAADRGAARRLLERTTVWLCDRHERGELGLASADASPTEEIEYLLGAVFDSIERPRGATR
jgi:hypothetical protein